MKIASRKKIFLIRFFLATAVFSGTGLILSSVHDYPQTINQLRLIRIGDNIAVSRPWIALFYFLNEAGSGMKFLLTGNERHMDHFPSSSHIIANHIARAENGDWKEQIRLANRYHLGESVKRDDEKALYWLARAQQNAPLNKREKIAKIIWRLRQDLEVGKKL
ncbi:SEL1-like repeat protein [Candidatus Persebacteraceae bacterium Df01]|jgi:TPR repeat protein|uniref:SEL1-like repeat protein n=1 Tax=Candidatus Doriopsillibacter californiensis TaxID=2970740 RepID=A0ABT7QMD2_9GAMM|nr:SEL1-like repeat protein [Candidatus Persebacteraceae bacterium Df01]